MHALEGVAPTDAIWWPELCRKPRTRPSQSNALQLGMRIATGIQQVQRSGAGMAIDVLSALLSLLTVATYIVQVRQQLLAACRFGSQIPAA